MANQRLGNWLASTDTHPLPPWLSQPVAGYFYNNMSDLNHQTFLYKRSHTCCIASTTMTWQNMNVRRHINRRKKKIYKKVEPLCLLTILTRSECCSHVLAWKKFSILIICRILCTHFKIFSYLCSNSETGAPLALWPWTPAKRPNPPLWKHFSSPCLELGLFRLPPVWGDVHQFPKGDFSHIILCDE